MTDLLEILASTSSWIDKITPQSSIVRYHIFSSPVYQLLDTKFSPSSIDWNIVVKDILQMRPRWTHESEVKLSILPYRRLT